MSANGYVPHPDIDPERVALEAALRAEWSGVGQLLPTQAGHRTTKVTRIAVTEPDLFDGPAACGCRVDRFDGVTVRHYCTEHGRRR